MERTQAHRRTRPDRPHRRAACRPGIEALEGRRLLSADATFGAAATRKQDHVDGSGLAVAVIDTGVNYRHEALGGGIGPGHKVATGYDFADGDPDPIAPAAQQHGTAVAGLIASADPAHPGVAPGAGIVPLRVFGADGQGDFDAIADALQWVIDHHAQYGITVVNLSVSDGNNYIHNWFATEDGGVGQRITALIKQLDDLNIPVVAAAGNSFNGQPGMGFVAIDQDTISVSSVGPSGQLSADAQRLDPADGGASATKLVAPGENLVAPVQGDQFAPVSGTSFAAALVSGAVVLLQQVYQSRFGQLPTVAQLEDWLQRGSDPVADPATHATYDELDIPKAAALVPSPSPSPTSPPARGPAANVPPPQAPAVATTPAPSTSTLPAPVPVAVPTTAPAPTSPSPSPSTTPPVANTPAPPVANTPALEPGTTVLVNGQAQGVAPDPSLAGLTALLSSLGTFSKIQVWTSVPAVPSLGSTRPAGTLALARARAHHRRAEAVGQHPDHLRARHHPRPQPARGW